MLMNPKLIALLIDLANVLEKHKGGLTYTRSDDGVHVTVEDLNMENADWPSADRPRVCIGWPENGDVSVLRTIINQHMASASPSPASPSPAHLKPSQLRLIADIVEAPLLGLCISWYGTRTFHDGKKQRIDHTWGIPVLEAFEQLGYEIHLMDTPESEVSMAPMELCQSAKSSLTTDPNDPRLSRYNGPEKPGPQNEAYLILPPEERAKGFIRPVRRTYLHTTCGVTTTMGRDLAETYARQPSFYGATFCCRCGAHFPVGEFTWDDTNEIVGS